MLSHPVVVHLMAHTHRTTVILYPSIFSFFFLVIFSSDQPETYFLSVIFCVSPSLTLTKTNQKTVQNAVKKSSKRRVIAMIRQTKKNN